MKMDGFLNHSRPATPTLARLQLLSPKVCGVLMKLAGLNAAIRNNNGAPKLKLKLSEDDTVGITIGLVKGDFLNGLKERFNRNDETGIWIDDDGWVRFETSRS